jgi:hypothetical protein
MPKNKQIMSAEAAKQTKYQIANGFYLAASMLICDLNFF